jgi:hypothetical protein
MDWRNPNRTTFAHYHPGEGNIFRVKACRRPKTPIFDDFLPMASALLSKR